jgi:tetratricopeptide (TPR) repeat protein
VQARALVGPISKDASRPENAYVLGALDLAETTPTWSTVVDRLRTAAADEHGAGRARPTLIYALARSGDIAEAASELKKLESAAKHHPLLGELRRFVERHSAAVDGGVEGGAEVAALDPESLPKLDTSPGAVDEARSTSGGDFRGQLKQASLALQRGDLATADALYRVVLSRHPENTEAMAGVAEVARRRKDPETARRMYEKVLERNPSYLPALIASADSKWEAGDRKGALTLYRRVLEQAGPGTEYGQRAAARIAQVEREGQAAPAEPSPPYPPEPSPPTGQPAEEKPHIDTTDLPEFNE